MNVTIATKSVPDVFKEDVIRALKVSNVINLIEYDSAFKYMRLMQDKIIDSPIKNMNFKNQALAIIDYRRREMMYEYDNINFTLRMENFIKMDDLAMEEDDDFDYLDSDPDADIDFNDLEE